MSVEDNIIQVKKGDFLVREGEEGSEMYYLQKGIMQVIKRRGDSEVQIGTIYSGEVVGEMSFLDKAPRSASVKAASDCELVEIHSEKFERLMGKLPIWYKALIHTLLERLRRANARIRI